MFRVLGNWSVWGKTTHLESEVGVNTVEKVSFLGLLKVLVLPAFCSALAGVPSQLSVRCSFLSEASRRTCPRGGGGGGESRAGSGKGRGKVEAAPLVWSPWRGGLNPRQDLGIPGPASKPSSDCQNSSPPEAQSQPGAWNLDIW